MGSTLLTRSFLAGVDTVSRLMYIHNFADSLGLSNTDSRCDDDIFLGNGTPP